MPVQMTNWPYAINTGLGPKGQYIERVLQAYPANGGHDAIERIVKANGSGLSMDQVELARQIRLGEAEERRTNSAKWDEQLEREERRQEGREGRRTASQDEYEDELSVDNDEQRANERKWFGEQMTDAQRDKVIQSVTGIANLKGIRKVPLKSNLVSHMTAIGRV